MGFNNPITGQNGELIRDQIVSSNFSLSAKTGWGILRNGQAYFYDVTAEGSVTANQVVLVGSGEVLLGYTGTPAAGNLFLAIAPAAGSDSFGNSWAQGVNVISGNTQAVMGETGGSPLWYAGTGNANIKNSGALQATLKGAGNAAYDLWQMLGPQDLTELDFAAVQCLSSSKDASQQALAQLVYQDSSGVEHFLLVGSFAGINIPAGFIAGIHPGTGTSRTNVAVAETWQTPVLGSGWATGDVGGGYQGLQYRKQPDGSVWLIGEVHSTSTTPAATIFTLPSGYFNATANMGQRFPVETNSGVVPAANAILVSTAGAVSLLANLTAANTNVVIDAIIRTS